MNKNKYFVGTIVSHLGRLSFNSLSKINIENIISLPNHQPLTTFSIVITEYKNKTNIEICSYKNQIPKDILKNIIEDMERMGMKKIVFFSTTAFGHINSVYPVISKLVKNNSSITISFFIINKSFFYFIYYFFIFIIFICFR